jgi:hypothetical protein
MVGIVSRIRIVSIPRKKKGETILRIFREITPKSIIAILAADAGMSKITIHNISGSQRRAGNHFHKFPVLGKKRLAEIIIPAVIKPVPFVRIPAFAAINDKRVIRRMNAKNLLLAHFARMAVKRMPFSAGLAPHIPALRTPSRRRDFYFLVKLEIFRLYSEIFPTILAILNLQIHIFSIIFPYSLIRAN